MIPKTSKYGVSDKAARTVDGIVFDSAAEAARYCQLRQMERLGLIRDLELQPSFVLQPKFEREGVRYAPIRYRADFRYYSTTDKMEIVEDVKGYKTAVYEIKKKMLLRHFPSIEFREVPVR